MLTWYTKQKLLINMKNGITYKMKYLKIEKHLCFLKRVKYLKK